MTTTQTTIPDQKNPALLLPTTFTPHTSKWSRLMLDACRAVIANEGWDKLKALCDALDTRYAALALAPVAMNSGVPVLSDLEPRQGRKLTVNIPQYDGIPEGTITYQWVRGASTDIGGANDKDYTPVLADVGETLKCKVTVDNNSVDLVQTSAASAAVVAA